MTRWGMVIDLNRCIGCEACTVACKAQNVTPKGVSWLRIVKTEVGTYPHVQKLPFPLQCQHCETSPCVRVCPTKATYLRDDGLVAQDETKCIGCKYCVIACPYGTRTFVESIDTYYASGRTALETYAQDFGPAPDASKGLPAKHQAGVVEKCLFCIQKVESGIAAGLKPGVDPDATPACVVTCIGGSRTFGDLDDPTSAVSKMASAPGAYRFHEEFGTNPKVYYLPVRPVK